MKPWSLRGQPSLQTHYLLRDSGVEEIRWDALHPMVLIGRSCCLFLEIEVQEVPPSARDKYIALKLKVASPWESFGQYIAIGNERASCWIWDKQLEAKLIDEFPHANKTVRFLPETVLHPAANEGAHIASCNEGLDYQHWRDGELRASRWSANTLSDNELDTFLRACGEENLSDSAPAELAWLSAPWSEPERDLSELIKDEKLVMSGIAAALIFMLFLELGMFFSASLRTQLATNNTVGLQQELGSRLQNRLMAERYATANAELSSLLPKFTQLELVAEFERLLAGQDYELVKWEYTQGALLVNLINPELDTRDIVSRLEGSELFADARIQPGRRDGEHVLQIRLKDDQA